MRRNRRYDSVGLTTDLDTPQTDSEYDRLFEADRAHSERFDEPNSGQKITDEVGSIYFRADT